MILFNCCCGNDHVFEAWFKDNATFEAQASESKIHCPICHDCNIRKAPMAPNIAKKKEAVQNIQKAVTKAKEHIESNFDYVGDQFADEARKIHYGEKEKRNIYGETTNDEAKELLEEGVSVQYTPWLNKADN